MLLYKPHTFTATRRQDRVISPDEVVTGYNYSTVPVLSGDPTVVTATVTGMIVPITAKVCFENYGRELRNAHECYFDIGNKGDILENTRITWGTYNYIVIGRPLVYNAESITAHCLAVMELELLS